MKLEIHLTKRNERRLEELINMEETVGLIWGLEEDSLKHQVFKAYKKHKKKEDEI